MKVPRAFSDTINFISEAMSRIFGVTDDKYPNTGVQPFDGDPLDKKTRTTDW